MIYSEKTSAIMMIALVLIYLIECQNKEEKYIAFLMEKLNDMSSAFPLHIINRR